MNPVKIFGEEIQKPGHFSPYICSLPTCSSPFLFSGLSAGRTLNPTLNKILKGKSDFKKALPQRMSAKTICFKVLLPGNVIFFWLEPPQWTWHQEETKRNLYGIVETIVICHK